MSKKIIIAGITGLVLIGGGVFTLTSLNSNQNSNNQLTLGINSGELDFYQFVKTNLKDQGVELKIQTFDDYIQPNLALGNDKLDVNAFQHIPYLNEFKKQHPSDKGVQEIKVLGKTIVSPLRLYSNKYSNVNKFLKQKTLKIAIPNDATNEARSLQLLATKGLIKLNKSGLNVTIKDVVKTNYNVELKELDAAQTPKVLNEVDASVINGNYAQVNNVGLDKALIVESSNVYHTFDNIVAGKDKITKKTAFQKFIAFLKSPKAVQKRQVLNKYDLVVSDK